MLGGRGGLCRGLSGEREDSIHLLVVLSVWPPSVVEEQAHRRRVGEEEEEVGDVSAIKVCPEVGKQIN